MTSTLFKLAKIVSSGIEDIERVYSERELDYPSLDEPFLPSTFDDNSSLALQRQLVIAAAAQIIATLTAPIDVLKQSAMSFYTAAALGFVVDIQLADVLKDAGCLGLHVDSIAAATGTDANNLKRILRYLATRHIFREIAPDIYTNNRISSLLTTTRQAQELEGQTKTFTLSPISAHVSHFADEGLRCAHSISPFLRGQNEEAQTPFNAAVNFKSSIWDWYVQPGNEWRARRFAAAMTSNAKRFPSRIISDGIEAESLHPGDIVVDVGGGVGSATLELYKFFPHLRYVVQDLESPIAAAKRFWNGKAPDAIASGTVTFQVHSFFSEQVVKAAKVYFLRFITHDWCDSDVQVILTHLRNASAPDTRLVLFETIARCTCVAEDSVPNPLLGNLGIAGAGIDTAVDLHLLSLFNGKERTEQDFRNLGVETGWELQKIGRGILASIVYKPK
ncbi:hypothetical protein VKT23_014212 [Stygiomarasmius scandens]|uniref:S-adenosyl-L-methionine-dependent methyltransferase n=1 Tax=Marasmiellus scandens TaxID=2682957 RepID=A0ABR1J0R6_9AGAR